MTRHYEIKVFGRVQGVGFRYAAQSKARSLNLKGWVENRPDGSVQTIIQGEEAACALFIQWCRTGTGYSWTERLEISEQKVELMEGFHIRR